MRVFLLVLMLGFSGAVLGQGQVWCVSSERFDGRLIQVGDSEREVIENEPDRTVRLETHEGGAAGYRYEFYKRGRTIFIYTSGGVVTRVCRVRE